MDVDGYVMIKADGVLSHDDSASMNVRPYEDFSSKSLLLFIYPFDESHIKIKLLLHFYKKYSRFFGFYSDR